MLMILPLTCIHVCVYIYIYIYIYTYYGTSNVIFFSEPGFCFRSAHVLRKFCRDCHGPLVKCPNIIAEICGDDESAQQLCGRMSNSWLAKLPSPA